MYDLSDDFFSKDEISFMIYDVLRTLTMQLVVQGLVVANNSGLSFISMDFIQVTLFLILGIIVFWMIVYKYLSKNNIIENYLTKRKLFN
jgi:hypothetical protein